MFRASLYSKLPKPTYPPTAFNLIFAIDEQNGIGYKNQLPWQHTPLKKDLQFFKYMTTFNENSNVIMGSNTWKSLSSPLKERKNIVISRNFLYPCTYSFPSIKSYKENIKSSTHWIIGGKQLYEHIFNHYYTDIECIMYSKIHASYPADTHLSLSNIGENFMLIGTHSVKDIVPITFHYYYNMDFLYLPNRKSFLDNAWYSFINRNKDYP
jgi:dihydrofolate reductase